MRNTRNKLLSGALSLTVSALIVKIIGVIFKVPLSYMLGDEGMGYFNSAYTVYGFFYVIACSGLPKAITIVVAGISKSAADSELRGLCKRLLLIFGMTGGIITLAFIAFAPQISQLIGTGEAVYTMLAIGPTILFVALGGVLRGFLGGLSSFKPIAFSQLIEAICKLALGLTFAYVGIKLGMSLPMISAFSVLGITLGAFFSAIYLYANVFWKNSGEKTGQKPSRKFDKNGIRAILKLAIPITASASIMSISSLIDLGLVIGGLKAAGYSEVEATAIYGNYTTLVTPMLNLVTALLSPISVALLPRLVDMHTRGKESEFTKAVNSSWLIVSLIAAPISFVYYLYAFDTLDIIFSVHTAANAAVSLSAIAPAALLLPLLTIANTALEAKGRVGCTVISLLGGVAIKIIVSTILIPKQAFGIVGASLSTVISYLVSLAISLIFLANSGRVRIHTQSSLSALVMGAVSFIPPFILLYMQGALGGGALLTTISLALSGLVYILTAIPYLILNKIGSEHHNAQKNII